MKLEDLTREEKSLLLYLETRAVDHSGGVDVSHMNKDDMGVTDRWCAEGFVRFGRICYASIQVLQERGGRSASTYWCVLSDEAWRLAHEERTARGKRSWLKRDWATTEEKQADGL